MERRSTVALLHSAAIGGMVLASAFLHEDLWVATIAWCIDWTDRECQHDLVSKPVNGYPYGLLQPSASKKLAV